MDCIVRKLKASVNNPDLPVFENVVLKNWLTTTQDDQVIRIPGIESDTQDTQIEVWYIPTSTSNTTVVVSMAGCYVFKNQGYCKVYAYTQGDNVEAPADAEVHAGFDSSNGSWFVGETTGTATRPASSYTAKNFAVFGKSSDYNGSKAGLVKIKKIKVTTSNNDVYILVPALVNNVACLLDEERGNTYFEYNNGTLLCG